MTTAAQKKQIASIVAMVDQLQTDENEIYSKDSVHGHWKYTYHIHVPKEPNTTRAIVAHVDINRLDGAPMPYGGRYPVFYKPNGTPFIEWHACRGYSWGCGEYDHRSGTSAQCPAPLPRPAVKQESGPLAVVKEEAPLAVAVVKEEEKKDDDDSAPFFIGVTARSLVQRMKATSSSKAGLRAAQFPHWSRVIKRRLSEVRAEGEALCIVVFSEFDRPDWKFDASDGKFLCKKINTNNEGFRARIGPSGGVVRITWTV